MDWLSAFFTNLFVVPLARRFPLRCLDRLALAIGQGAYFFVPRRRRAALENLRRFYRGEKTEEELKELARRSSASLALGAMENLRCRRFDDRSLRAMLNAISLESIEALRRAKALHEQTGGCIFVTAHIGGYALLPYFFAEAGIPLTVPINPLRNRAVQNRWCPLNRERAPGAEVFVPKKNSLTELLKALDDKRSVGILADQRSSPMHAVDSQATAVVTMRVPALLALQRARPIVAGACFRNPAGERFRIVIGEPLWPAAIANGEEAEIARLTDQLDRSLAQLVRASPVQYLWMHNRWKPHRVRAAARQAAV